MSGQKQNQPRRRTPPQALKLQIIPSPPPDEMIISGTTDSVAPSSSSTSKKNFHSSFLPTLQHFSRRLVPLVSITTGQPHPDFPRTILAYHLLTSEQLDDLARHYHQVWPPVPETFGYPLRIPAWIGTPDEAQVDIETKRRRLGRFAGLRGCESPVASSFGTFPSASASASASASNNSEGTDCADDDDDDDARMRMLEEQMEREWQEALRRARCEQDPDAILRRKAGGYWFHWTRPSNRMVLQTKAKQSKPNRRKTIYYMKSGSTDQDTIRFPKDLTLRNLWLKDKRQMTNVGVTVIRVDVDICVASFFVASEWVSELPSFYQLNFIFLLLLFFIFLFCYNTGSDFLIGLDLIPVFLSPSSFLFLLLSFLLLFFFFFFCFFVTMIALH